MATKTEHESCATVTRAIAAPAEAIYAAWTEAERMRAWLAPAVEADARVGGAYRIENPEEDGSVAVHRGQFLTLEPGRRIAMTLRNDASPPGSYEDEQVEITLRPLDPDRTVLTLTHAWNATELTEEHLDALRAGWGIWLDLLENALAVASEPDTTH
jgi:uncharacterized protein YndB with AHSA1/START domain